MTTEHQNRLSQEKSPYLLQHAHNPVDWYSWGDEAFAKARREDKPIFLSIGYATCHWCHVMERESFENENIAAIMNEFFVNIKVDREERPDVDQIYMASVQAMTGHGGWPLSAFLTPDLKPFFGGTYFPPSSRHGRPGFPDILKEMARLWREDRPKLLDWGQQLYDALNDQSHHGGGELSVDIFTRVLAHLKENFDAEEGGFGSAPKFPRSDTLSLLLRMHKRTGDKEALTMVQKTLDKMARGGIYDHLGGGFHRYSTDRYWLAPHFEKMLYDNALLIKTYLEAYQVDKNPMWKSVVEETIHYVLRDMTSPEGGFYSAEDADSEGVEGKFYVWDEKELENILSSEDASAIKKYFHTKPAGNFEGHNILHLQPNDDWQQRQTPALSSLMSKLLTHRTQRIPPLKDDKILTSWNGLMISALAKASQVIGSEAYLLVAQKSAQFILSTLYRDGTLYRRYRDGDVRYEGGLEDYSFFIQALLDLYESDFNEEWIKTAIALEKKTTSLFWDKDAGGYFASLKDPTLVARMKEIYDGAIPSGNSIMALNLLRLEAFTSDAAFGKRAEDLLNAFSGFVSRNPQATPALLMAYDWLHDSVKEIAIIGPKNTSSLKQELLSLHQHFLPNKIIAYHDAPAQSLLPLLKDRPASSGNDIQIFLCENQTCRQPVTSFLALPDFMA